MLSYGVHMPHVHMQVICINPYLGCPRKLHSDCPISSSETVRLYARSRHLSRKWNWPACCAVRKVWVRFRVIIVLTTTCRPQYARRIKCLWTFSLRRLTELEIHKGQLCATCRFTHFFPADSLYPLIRAVVPKGKGGQIRKMLLKHSRFCCSYLTFLFLNITAPTFLF